MATALSEIMKQVESLPAYDQKALAAQLSARNGYAVGEAAESESVALDVFSLALMPPEDAYTVAMRFEEAGEGEPARFDFTGIFNDEGADEGDIE